jgi:hypothetical protein
MEKEKESKLIEMYVYDNIHKFNVYDLITIFTTPNNFCHYTIIKNLLYNNYEMASYLAIYSNIDIMDFILKQCSSKDSKNLKDNEIYKFIKFYNIYHFIHKFCKKNPIFINASKGFDYYKYNEDHQTVKYMISLIKTILLIFKTNILNKEMQYVIKHCIMPLVWCI